MTKTKHEDYGFNVKKDCDSVINVFCESVATYTLVINHSNESMKLDAYIYPEPDPINFFYLHNNHEIKEYLGDTWESMPPVSIILELISYLY